jgi:NAD(P)-dependent dehydrogenase (short-subunit alcohol dehydrogenase family)
MKKIYRRFQGRMAAPGTASGNAGRRKDGAPVALVTGANSGFGLETVRVLAGQGCRVYGTYRKASRSRELSDLAGSGKIRVLPMDVTRPRSVREALRRIGLREGRLDVLVNNAGSVTAGFLEELSDAEWRGQFEVNLFGPLRVTREALPFLKRSRRGIVLNVGSISGRAVYPGIGAYAASKFALRSVTEGMRMELGTFGIQVGEIAPGNFTTRVVDNARFARGTRKGGSPYRPFADQVEKLARENFRKGAPARRVAELIGRIVERGRVKPAYLVGTDAEITAFLRRVLPDAWFEGILKYYFPWARGK